MAEATSSSHPSRYVKLTRDQEAAGSGEDIRPGELNQPVAVPQLERRRCGECGQVLPEGHRAPADEPWTTGIFGCADDPESFGICARACCEDMRKRCCSMQMEEEWSSACGWNGIIRRMKM